MKTYFFYFLLLGFCCGAFTQEKFEREYRIKQTKVPEMAKLYIAQFQFDKKVKWFIEESQDGKTIEAKSLKNKRKYSVEFSEKGELVDVEKQVKLKELSKEVQQKINTTLTTKYQRFKIKKLQIQYKGNKEKVLQALVNSKNLDGVFINYELVVKAKKGEDTKRFELLIDENGTVLKELIFKNTLSLNLEF